MLMKHLNMKMYGEWGGTWLATCLVPFISGTCWVGRWAGPRTCLILLEKSAATAGN